jgi:anthranilate/para-aminobenzoate synthase component I
MTEMLTSPRRREERTQGAHSGALEWIGFDGRAGLGVVIRSLVVSGDRLQIGTGGAVTVHSTARAEYDETRLKITQRMGILVGHEESGVGHVPAIPRAAGIEMSDWEALP